MRRGHQRCRKLLITANLYVETGKLLTSIPTKKGRKAECARVRRTFMKCHSSWDIRKKRESPTGSFKV